jgi:hypothetical protein
MLRKRLFPVSLISTFCITSVFAWGQKPVCPAVDSVSQQRNVVGCTLPYLYGPTVALPVFQHGFLVDTTAFADFGNNKSALPATLGTELTTLPLSAPASGYVFQLDKASGLEVRSTQSLGPILAERGDTIGRHKLFVAFSYQYFRFTTEDGIHTNALHSVNQHVQSVPPADEDADLASSNDAVDLKIHQFAAFLTYGVTDRIDVSAVVPFLDVRLGAHSTVTLQNISDPDYPGPYIPPNTPEHSFCQVATAATPCLTMSFSNFNESTGIGDVVFRVKARVWGREQTKFAAGADLRLPTGDELNYRGSGTYGVRPFVAFSFSKGRISPHANFGFQINGDSILAGDIYTGTKAHLPNEATYSVGADLGISSKFTIAADWLGERVIDGFRLRQSSCSESAGAGSTCIVGASGTYTFPVTVGYRAGYNMNDIAIGAKFSPVKNLLITANGMFKVDDPGLRSRVVPMIGIGYTF